MAKGAESSTKREGGGTPAGGNAPVKAATPWGMATVIEEVKVAQRAGDKRFASIFQLLESDRKEALVRIAYTTDGIVRPGPLTLRAKDLERLRAELDPGSALAAAFGWPGGEA